MPSVPRSAEATTENPTGVPMAREGNMWVPGNGNNVQQFNPRITVSPKFENIGNGGSSDGSGGESRSIPVSEAPSTPAETTGDPRIDALIERFSQQGEQINQLMQQQAQMLEVLQELVRQRGGDVTTANPTEPAPTESDPANPPDNRRPAAEVWDEAHAENERIDQERAAQQQAEMDRLHAEALAEDAQREGVARQERANQAQAALNQARDDLVRMTILHRARSISSLWHRNENREYNQARENYNNALREYMAAQADAMRVQNPNISNGEIIEALAPQEYAEQRAFAERVGSMDRENFENGNMSFRDRMLRRWANTSTKKKLIIGTLVSVGVGAGASAALGVGVAGIAVGLMARYSVGILNHVASARNVSEKSVRAEVRRINGREQQDNGRRVRSRLRFGPNNQSVDDYLDNVMLDRNNSYHSGENFRSKGRNWFGLGLMGASGVLVGSELAGVDLLGNIPVPGFLTHAAHEVGEKLGIGGDHHTSEGGFRVPGGNGSEYAGWGVKPNTIHATNMTEFNKGVVDLLNKQGIHVSNFNQHVLDHMNHYMENRPMASGMGAHGQHLVSGKFNFGNPSHAQGFEIGSNGNGQAELLKWMDEAHKAGASISKS